MSQTIRAYAAQEAKAPLKTFEYQPPPLGPNEVRIDITHCGVCHSDIKPQTIITVENRRVSVPSMVISVGTW